MTQKILAGRFHQIFTIVLCFFATYTTYSQCAGDDNSITVCTPESFNQGIGNSDGIINLFNLLNGTPSTGGVWSDLNSSGGLDITTGMLNIWSITQSGVYQYQYTVTDQNCPINNATITLTLGGFPGVDNPSAVACNNNPHVPLFSFLGSNPNPHSNGTWTGGPAGTVSGNIFNAQLAGVGTYTLFYTVPALANCPSRTATVTLTVHPQPNSGTSSSLLFCETDDLAAYTNVDLFDLLTGEDSGGTWSDNNGTGELTYLGDSFIDIQNIANTLGAGIYVFNYNVNSSHPICSPTSTSVSITIEQVVDLNFANLIIPNICQDDLGNTTITATVTQGATAIEDGTYDITYLLTGVNSGTATVSVTFVGGVATFIINEAFLTNIGITNVQITSVVDYSTTLDCIRIITNLNSTFEIYENPNLSDSNLIINNICLGTPAIVNVSDNTASDIELSDGTYLITYDITGPNGTETGLTTTVTVTAGNFTFQIPNSVLDGSGNYTVTITNIKNITTGCSSDANLTTGFIIFSPPNGSGIFVMIEDTCEGEDLIVTITGASALNNGTYDIAYNLNGATNLVGQVATDLEFTNGTATFTIPANLVNVGISGINLTNLVLSSSGGTSNNCGTSSFSISSDSFEIFPLPDPLGLTLSAENICFGSDLDIILSGGTNLPDGEYTISYAISGTTTITNTTTLTITDGEGSINISSDTINESGVLTFTIESFIYGQTECGANTTLISAITFIVTDPGTPTLTDGGNIFCIEDHPVISNLTDAIVEMETIIWYDSPEFGTPYEATDLLVHGNYYYAALVDEDSCESSIRLEVLVDLTGCELFIPDGFSPNGDGLNDEFYIKDIELVYPKFELEIYNRYGNLVYRGNINTPRFNGKANQPTSIGNDLLPSGVYFYIVNYNDSNNTAPIQGRLYLSR
jgi:gliding motility-associated-like protein